MKIAIGVEPDPSTFHLACLRPKLWFALRVTVRSRVAHAATLSTLEQKQ